MYLFHFKNYNLLKNILNNNRLLKFGKRITLGIGDNREHCFYVPVSFNLFRQYINQGFEIEELVIN